MVGRYLRGDFVKIEVTNEHSGEVERMWLLVDSSNDEQQLVFGQLDSEPIIVTDMKKGTEPGRAV